MNRKIRIKDIPPEYRPYEKCVQYGPAKLSDSELLAVIIRTGSKEECSTLLARRILELSGNKQGVLNIINLSFNELMEIKGIGPVKAAQIMCIGELSKRISKKSAGYRLTFTNPKTIADYYMEELRHNNQECLILMLLNTKCVLINEIIISKGTVNASFVSARDIFIHALKNQAVFIILVHNHPSGNPMPSKDDIANTKKISDAGKLIGISLIDHIIIGDNSYVSLKEQGLNY